MSQLEKRKMIVNKRLENPGMSLNKLSELLKYPCSVVQNVIGEYEKDLTIERKPGSGRRPVSSQPTIEEKVNLPFRRNPILFERTIANMLKISQSTVYRIKRRKGLRPVRVQKVPNRGEKQDLTIYGEKTL